jgi:hypothetical protein
LWAITTVTKKFKIDRQNIKQLIKSIGGCMATDKITVNGELVDFMYRDSPDLKMIVVGDFYLGLKAKSMQTTLTIGQYMT